MRYARASYVPFSLIKGRVQRVDTLGKTHSLRRSYPLVPPSGETAFNSHPAQGVRRTHLSLLTTLPTPYTPY